MKALLGRSYFVRLAVSDPWLVDEQVPPEILKTVGSRSGESGRFERSFAVAVTSAGTASAPSESLRELVGHVGVG